MKRFKFLLCSFLFLLSSFVFAQEAVISDLTGTVETKQTGSASWENAVKGQTVSGDTMISTGFKSTALITIGNSVLVVRPLTRLTLAEIRALEGIENINAGLQTGRVRVDVNPPSGARTSFSIQSPMATASVRGTVFEVATYSLSVLEGSVEYRGTSGAPVVIDAGGSSSVDARTGRAAFAKEALLSSLSPSQPIAFDSFQSFRGAATVQQSNDIEIIGNMEFD